MMHGVQSPSQVLLQPLVPHVCLMRPGYVIPSLLRPLLLRYADAVLPAHINVYCGLGDWLPPDAVSKPDDFIQDHLSHIRHTLDHLETKVERRGTLWLVRCVVPDVQIRVFQCLLNRYSGCGVESEHAVEKVKSVMVGSREKPLERHFGHKGKIADVFLSTWRANAAKGFFVRGSEVVENLVELVNIIPTLEEWPAAKKFRQNTTHGPHINWWSTKLTKSISRRIYGTLVTYLLWCSFGNSA